MVQTEGLVAVAGKQKNRPWDRVSAGEEQEGEFALGLTRHFDSIFVVQHAHAPPRGNMVAIISTLFRGLSGTPPKEFHAS